jgi:hypothetical protein
VSAAAALFANRSSAHANAVRTDVKHAPGLSNGQRATVVHLTGHAPGCAHLAIGDARRWRTFWNTDAARVMRGVLTRLKCAPGEIRLTAAANGDIEVTGARPIDADAPMALIFDGHSLEDLADALTALRRRGWMPPVVLSAALSPDPSAQGSAR